MFSGILFTSLAVKYQLNLNYAIYIVTALLNKKDSATGDHHQEKGESKQEKIEEKVEVSHILPGGADWTLPWQSLCQVQPASRKISPSRWKRQKFPSKSRRLEIGRREEQTERQSLWEA